MRRGVDPQTLLENYGSHVALPRSHGKSQVLNGVIGHYANTRFMEAEDPNALSNYELERLYPIIDKDKPEDVDVDKWRKRQMKFLGAKGCRSLIQPKNPWGDAFAMDPLQQKAVKDAQDALNKQLIDSLQKGTSVFYEEQDSIPPSSEKTIKFRKYNSLS